MVAYIVLAISFSLIFINRFVKKYNFIIMSVFSLSYLASLMLFLYFRKDIWVFILVSVFELIAFLLLEKGDKQ